MNTEGETKMSYTRASMLEIGQHRGMDQSIQTTDIDNILNMLGEAYSRLLNANERINGFAMRLGHYSPAPACVASVETPVPSGAIPIINEKLGGIFSALSELEEVASRLERVA